MSGKFLARVQVTVVTLALAACGGGEDSTPLAGGGDSSSGGGDGNQQEVSLELGTGSGSDFQSGQMDASATSLSSGGSTRLEFNVVNAADGNSIYNTESTQVAITSLCDTAVFDTPVVTSSGKFSITYEAGCSGPDTITARLDNGATALKNITVSPQEVGTLSFASVSPDSIALAGSGNASRGTVADVTFKLSDNTGKPIKGQLIEFALSTEVGGITLSQTDVETDASGEAKTSVNSGSVPTVVSVTATTTLSDNTTIQSTSAPISISSSIPDQDSFSVSVDNFLPNAMFHDGENANITIRAADRNNNAIDGATANFITDAGSIQSECNIQGGACTVQWTSQNPRPTLGGAKNGIVHILVRTVGEESFEDLNSDGKYTYGTDSFPIAKNDKGEAFLDTNSNKSYDSGQEPYFDYNNNGVYDGGNAIYNGTACTEGDPNCTTQLLEISESARLYMTSDAIVLSFTTPLAADSNVCALISGRYEDDTGLEIDGPPPGKTAVAFSTTNGRIIGESSFETTTKFRATPVEMCVYVESDDTPDSGTFTVEVTPPSPYSGPKYVLNGTITD